MNTAFRIHRQTNSTDTFARSRLTRLFMEAMEYPVVTVCLGAGKGKKNAINDFARENHVSTIRIQLSERDNKTDRFWAKITHTMASINTQYSKALFKLGFPDTVDKLDQYYSIIHNYTETKQRIIIMENLHLIKNPSMLCFIKRAILKIPPKTSLFIVSRSASQFDTTDLILKGQLFSICENDLQFTESELVQYYLRQNSLAGQTLYSNAKQKIALNMIHLRRGFQNITDYFLARPIRKFQHS